MEYSLRAMELWFQHLPGSFILDMEQNALSEWFSQCSGTHCLQIGGPSNLSLIRSAHYPHKAYLSSQFASINHFSRIQSDLSTLPIHSDSIDMVVIAHLLEFASSPLEFLEESYRITSPEGYLILLAFNPWSFWGMTRSRRDKRGFPWSGNFYSSPKIRQYLKRVGYSIVLSKTLCFRPVLYDVRRYERWKWMERLGADCFPGLGGVSLVVAKKTGSRDDTNSSEFETSSP